MAAVAEVVSTDDFREVRLPREYVISQQGRDYVLADGLITGLHQLSGGYFDVETRLEQLPNESNGMLAVCSARVTVFSPDDRERVLRSATGLGDASPQNVGRLIVPHLVRMAETRALSRALRTLLCLGMVSFEELGQEEPAERREEPRASAPVPGAQHIVVEGKTYSRDEVQAAFHKRVQQARAAGLAITELEQLPVGQTPLAILVGKTQELRRRIEAKAPADAG